MIVVSLLLFLGGVALLAAGLVSESIILEVASIASALLAAMVLYFGVRQRGGLAVDETQAPSTPQNFSPLDSTWSRSADESPAEPEPVVDDSPDWLLDPPAEPPPAEPPPAEPPPAEPEQTPAAVQDLPDSHQADDEPDEEVVSDADARRVAERSDDVLVVDGRPRYHLQLCPTLGEDETVPLPVSEAREAGFTPCARCRPDSHILGDAWRPGSAR